MGKSNNHSILRDQLSGSDNCDKGAYILMLSVAEDTAITVGKLGVISFSAGAYAYVGSALGSGGFQRVRRHIAVFAGHNKKLTWHIDYLSAIATLRRVYVIATNKRIECDIARRLSMSPSLTAIKRFGSSDCKCDAHLFYSDNMHRLEPELKEVACGFVGYVTYLELTEK
ncbi:MAG: GIY-YIG nuclease family protein [Halobacteriota archaeon]